jgi:hypothetical protein
MGDRYDRDRKKGLHPALRGLKPPREIVAWGLAPAARIGHNQGPPLEEPVDAFVRWRWRKAYKEAWKTPPMSILKLRVARAEAAGVTYREYMLELLDTGRHLQADDVAKRRAAAKPQPLGGDRPAGGATRTRGKRKPEPL